ncbi:T9SS type A sorting domain-containing protein [bacterium]|nr:T9SS type A sorting domain-containing protein [bacterium]
MKKQLFCVLILTAVVVSCFSFTRRSLVEINTNTGCGSCKSANDWLDEWYPLHIDDICVLRYHTSGPDAADPFYITNQPQNNQRAGMYSLGFVPLMIINGARQDDWSLSGALAESEAGAYTPFELEVFPIDTGICRVRLTCEDGGYDDILNLCCVLNEDTAHYDAPNGQTMFYQTMRYMLPNPFGEEIHIEGDTIIELDFDFRELLTYCSRYENCWFTVFVQDFTSPDSVIIQCNKRATDDLLDYFHDIKTDRFRELVAPDDTTVFYFGVFNFGRNNDQYDVWFEEDVPDGWMVDIRSGGVLFDSTRIAVSSASLQDFELRMSPCGDVGYGDVYLHITAVDDPEARLETFHFKAYSGGDMLLISSSAATEDIPYYDDFFTDHSIEYGLWSMEEHGLLPDISDLAFEAIIWNDGINLYDSLMISDREGMIGFLEDGGKMLITSGSIGRDVGGDLDFYHNCLGVDYDGLEFGATGVMGTYPGSFFTGYSCALPGLPAEGFLIRAGAGSEGILRLSTGPTCGLQKTFTSGGKLIYLSFMFESISNEAERDDLWNRIVQFWGGFSIDERYLPKSNCIISASPNPFNSAVSIKIDIDEPSKGTIEAFDMSGRRIAELYHGMISAEGYTVRWQNPDLPTGLYFIRVNIAGRSEEVKTLLIK